MVETVNDNGWIARCVAHFIGLDPQLDPELAQPIAADMAARTRWRAMAPEHAAQTVFDFGSKRHVPAG